MKERDRMATSPAHPTLQGLRGLVMDMDGVLYRGNEPTPGLVEFFDFLNAEGIRYLLLTNNSTTLPEGYSKKLAAMGVTVPAEPIMTSGTVLKTYLLGKYPPGTRIYGVCREPLQRLLLK